MKRSVGIGIGIGIAAVLVVIVFTNVDDLVSINIEDATSQISTTIEEATSQVEFSNPLQFYEIDSRCDLSYFLLDLHYSKKMSLQDTMDVDDKAELADEMMARGEEVMKEMVEKMGGDEEMAIKVRSGELTDADIQKIWDDVGQIVLEEFLVNPIMEKNSIHPKFRGDISELLKNVGSGYIDINPTRNPTYYNYIKITDEELNADPTCKKQHIEHFSDTMQMLKDNWGY